MPHSPKMSFWSTFCWCCAMFGCRRAARWSVDFGWLVDFDVWAPSWLESSAGRQNRATTWAALISSDQPVDPRNLSKKCSAPKVEDNNTHWLYCSEKGECVTGTKVIQKQTKKRMCSRLGLITQSSSSKLLPVVFLFQLVRYLRKHLNLSILDWFWCATKFPNLKIFL